MSVEESPEFKKALSEASGRQIRMYLLGEGYARGADNDSKGSMMEGIQQQRQKIEDEVAEARRNAEQMQRDLRIMGDPVMREITENLRRAHSAEAGFVCPQCSETDSHGNKVNGKPYCFKCQLPMVSREKAKKWIKPAQPKRFSRGFDEPDGVAKLRRR